jgi:hypothetical protein
MELKKYPFLLRRKASRRLSRTRVQDRNKMRVEFGLNVIKKGLRTTLPQPSGCTDCSACIRIYPEDTFSLSTKKNSTPGKAAPEKIEYHCFLETLEPRFFCKQSHYGGKYSEKVQHRLLLLDSRSNRIRADRVTECMWMYLTWSDISDKV